MFSETCSSIPDAMPRRAFLRSASALGGPAPWFWLLPIASEASIWPESAPSLAEAEHPTRVHRVTATILRILRGRDAESLPGEAGGDGGKLIAVSLKAAGFVLVLLVLSACATRFDRHNIGTAELWIGGQVQVQQECTRRGAVAYSNDAKIYGCADFQDRVIVSVSDPKIIAHEWCHWSTQSDSHEVCPTPVVDFHRHP